MKEDNKSFSYEDLEVRNLKFKIRSLTFLESLSFSKKSKNLKFYKFLKEFILLVTTLDDRQVSEMLIQDAISIILFYKMTFWDNVELVEGVTPRDLLFQNVDYKEEFVNFQGYRFTNFITIDRAIKAEELCYARGKFEYESFYILASSCTKKVSNGIDILIENSEDSEETRNTIKLINYNISKVSHAKIDLIADFENVSCITQDNIAVVLQQEFFFWE